MARQFSTIHPNELESAGLYDLLVAAAQPRPIAIVATLDLAGKPNLAPYSFYTIGGVHPASLVISPFLGHDGRPKSTLLNIGETGEFTVNSVDRKLAEKMADPNSEWQLETGDLVEAPRLLECPIQMECKLFQIVSHGAEPGSANYIIGEIVAVHVVSEWLTDGKVESELPLVGRLGGKDYLDLKNLHRFHLGDSH